NAWHFVELGDIGRGIAVDRSARGGDDVDFVFEDEFAGDFGRAAFVGLAVLGDHLDLVGLAAHLPTGRQDLTTAVERPILRPREPRHGAGLRRDVTDFDCEIGGAQNRGSKHRTRRKRRRAGLTINSARCFLPTSVFSSIVMSSLYGRRFLVSAAPTSSSL